MREVFLELIARYGQERPFDAATFFDTFVEATYPAVGPFFDAHVKDNQPLPYAAFFAKLGIELTGADVGTPSFSVVDECTDAQRELRGAWMRNL